jgi:N-carbamoylputrescine amidase
VLGDPGQNLERTRRDIARAAARGARIVCLEELFATPYFAQRRQARARNLAEPVPGTQSRFLAACARESGVTLVGGSIYERASDGRRFNTTLVFDDRGRQIGKYRKMHIPDDPGFYEQYYFAPGDLGYRPVNAAGAVLGPLICYDQWFPEAARAYVLGGAEILFYPTAIGWWGSMRQAEPSAARRWQQAMRAHASMNGVYAVAVNRVGREEGIDFWGGSFIADPFGDLVARASASRNEVLVAEIDLGRIRESRDGWGFLRNRRPESYRALSNPRGR